MIGQVDDWCSREGGVRDDSKNLPEILAGVGGRWWRVKSLGRFREVKVEKTENGFMFNKEIIC